MGSRDVGMGEGREQLPSVILVGVLIYPLHPQWDIRLQHCSSTGSCPLLQPEPRSSRAPYLVALPLLSFAILSLVVLVFWWGQIVN